jgi:hypothetical protein
MLKNHFPDSVEKRELRRRDERYIRQFCNITGRKIDYFGMPSVEFLDVICWREHLRRVVAIEGDPEVVHEMQIEKDFLDFRFPVIIRVNNVLREALDTLEAFDLYNLDFYGGFLYLKKQGGSNTIAALQAIFTRHAALRKPFILVTTFNVRETGAREYPQFFHGLRDELAPYKNYRECLDAHENDSLAKLKLCFPYFCWTLALASNFKPNFATPVCYSSKGDKGTVHRMIHFHISFMPNTQALPSTSLHSQLISLANQPLIELQGQVYMKRLDPTQIE